MNRKIKIGILGYASIAKRLMIPAILETKDLFELVAIGTRDIVKTTNEIENFFGEIVSYDALIANSTIEAIYMPLPTGLHEEWAIKALNNKKHLLVEKSFGLDHESTKRIVEVALSNKCVIMENFMFIYHSQQKWFSDFLSTKKIGEIRLFRSQFGFPPLDKTNFRYNKSLGGGALLDAGAYTLKASQYFFGYNLSVESSVLYIDKKLNVDLYGSMTLLSSNGVVCQLSFGFDNHYQCKYEFWGSIGTLLAKKSFTPKPNERPLAIFSNGISEEQFELDSDNHFIKILKAFYRNIVNQNHEASIQEILAQSSLLDQVRKNAKVIYI